MSERRLQVLGGLFEVAAETRRADTKDEVREALRWAAEAGHKLSLAAGQRSFGAQYLPAPGGVVLDLGELERGATELERAADGSIWIRAGGGTRFADLRRSFPRHRTHCPPTTDSITLAGALAACAHSAGGYFADSVRAFSLVCANGHTYQCRRDAPGLEGELFRHAVGAFGALGVVSDIELRMTPIAPDQQIAVHAVYAGPSDAPDCLDALENAADDPRYSEGNGLAIYGLRGHAIVFGDELLPAHDRRRGAVAPLTGEDVTVQILSQAVANRFPGFAEWVVSRTYRKGATLLAPWYGFQFFQRSYDGIHRVMAGRSVLATAMRLAGVGHGLPICHTAWFFPRERLREFVRGYFDVLSRFPALVRRIEQQDVVLLEQSQWPCHSMGRTAGKLGILTASFSLRGAGRAREEAEDFARTVTREAPAFAPGSRVSLCKQVHAEPHVLREMHRDYITRLERFRALVDPSGVIQSRFLAALGVN